MNKNTFISEKESEELNNTIISMKGNSGNEMLRFVVENLKPSQEYTIDKLEKGIDKKAVLAFISEQEKSFNELVRIARQHREITYEHLPFSDEFKNKELEKITEIENGIISYFNIITSLLISYINDLTLLGELAPTLERKALGKQPKRKKDAQITAENLAADIWVKNPTLSQEEMAYRLKERLNLSQSTRTIINWIKSFQPKP